MGTSVLHIKTEVECRVYLFDEEKGIAKPGTYFNLKVRKGEQDLLFVSTEDETVRCKTLYEVEENDKEYRMAIELLHFKQYPKELLKDINLAEQGDAEAQFRLGKRYYNGDGIEKDYAEAVKWWFKSAKLENNKAQYNLGVCYYNGKGVNKNKAEAVRLWHKSVEQGNVKAQDILGKYYYRVGMEYYSYVDDIDEAIQYFRKAAELGYSIAQKELGLLYKNGEDVKQDYSEAVKWFCMAAEQGDATARYYLGECYYNGWGVNRDYAKAVKWWHMAIDDEGKWSFSCFDMAEEDYCNAVYYLGECYYYGYGEEQNYAEAIECYNKVCIGHKKYAEAQYMIGICYENSEALDPDSRMAFRHYSLAANQGHEEASFKCGECYEYGRGCEKDYEMAIKMYHQAAEQENWSAENKLKILENNIENIQKAEQGDAEAQCRLGNRYYKYDHFKEAEKWWRKSADQGYAEAQYKLGCYYDEDGDYDEAEEWWRKSAEHGYAEAQYKLGCNYYNTRYESETNIDAVKWFKMAAEQGFAEAQTKLGECFYYGRGVGQDYEEAVKWLRIAADQEHDAQFYLGRCFYNGQGVEKNYVEAEYWFKRFLDYEDDGMEQGDTDVDYWYEKAQEQLKWEIECEYEYYSYADAWESYHDRHQQGYDNDSMMDGLDGDPSAYWNND